MEQLEQRNKAIQEIMKLYNCSYARAAQTYYAFRNYKK